MLHLLATVMGMVTGIEPEWFVAGGSFVAAWIRFERRITKLETQIEAIIKK